jgi:hypothetical protein
MSDLSDIVAAAREHAERLAQDVKLASTRMEHIRVTARANEAAAILAMLENVTGDAASDAYKDY